MNILPFYQISENDTAGELSPLHAVERAGARKLRGIFTKAL